MPMTVESPKAASDSASVNRGVMYSENSIPQLSSNDISRKSSLYQKRKIAHYKNIDEPQQSLSLSQKEKLFCNMYSKKILDNRIGAGFQDVRPEDVLRTFSNSIEPSKRSFMMQSAFQEELGNLSPIRNMRERRNVVNEIQKIAKEIRQIPTQDFRTEEFLKSKDARKSCDEEDSLLEELGKFSNKDIKINPYDNQSLKNDIDEAALKNYFDVPFSRVISSIESLKPNYDSYRDIQNKTTFRNSQIKEQSQKLNDQREAASNRILHNRMVSKSRIEDKGLLVLNENSSDLISPFLKQSKSAFGDINTQDQSQQQQNNQAKKINIKKNQIKFNNINSYVTHSRKMEEMQQQYSQNQNMMSQPQQQINNNFIEVNNSVIIVQKKSREESPSNQDNIVIDRPFSEMRKLRPSSNIHFNQNDYYSKKNNSSQHQYYQAQPNSSNIFNRNQMADVSQGMIQANNSFKKSQLGQSQLQRRQQNISVVDSNYMYNQSQLKGQSPNKSLNASINKRPQSSLNGSNILQDLSSFSPYIPNQKPVKAIKLQKKNSKKKVNLSNISQETSSRQSPKNQISQQQAIRVIKKTMINKIMNQAVTNNTNNAPAKMLKISDLGNKAGNISVLSKVANMKLRIQS